MSAGDDRLGDLKKKIKQAMSENSNVAAAVNVGGKGRHVTASSRQRVVHRNGVTTTITERHESKTSDEA